MCETGLSGMNLKIKQFLLDWAEIIDALRVFPRVFICWFFFKLEDIHAMYMADNNSPYPQFYVLAAWGGLSAITVFYINSGRKWG